jgi:hypothetical protein
MYEKAGSTQRSKNSPLGARPIGYLSPKLSLSWGNIIFISLSPRYEAGRKGAGPPIHILPGYLKNFCPTIRPWSAPKMNQPTSIQMLDAAIWQELGGEKANDAEAVYHTLGTLLSRWLLARSEYPEMEAIKLFAKVRAYIAQPERFL